MGWFDEQIKQRIIGDDNDFNEAFYKISDSVTGGNLSKKLQNDKNQTIGVISDIIRSYSCKVTEPDTEFENINDEIEYMCRPCGIMYRNVKLEKDWYRDAFCSLLAKNNETDEITALIPDRISGRYRYYDSKQGKLVKINKKLSGLFEGEAICFYKPLPLRKLKLKDIFDYGISLWSVRDIVLPLVLMAVVTAMGLMIPKLNHFLFNEVVATKNNAYLISTAIFLVCLSISKILTQTIQTLIGTKNSIKTSITVESAVMMRVMSLPTGFFKNYSSGDIMQRIKYANSVCGMLINVIFGSGIVSVLSLVYISQIISYGRLLIIPTLIIIALTVAEWLITSIADTKNVGKIMNAETKESGIAYSLITGVQKIKLSGAEKRAFSRWADKYADVSRASYNPPLIVALRSVFAIIISLVGSLLIYYTAFKSGITVADYYAFETAYAMVIGAVISLLLISDDFSNLTPILEMITPILDAEPEVSDGKKLIHKLSGYIELNNVSFTYDENMPPVLDNLSLKIKSGQYVAIVGKTGCGKSTLMRILLGFEKPNRGAVYYDGRDLETIDLKSLRRKIGTVMQNGQLFQGDIYSNITVSAPYLTLDDAWEAAAMAGMDEDIKRMPMGMQTLISEGGGGISGGQRQRLLIARAVAAKPSILFFDEATSALDNITQKIVSDSLDSLHCTRIVIAHRLSTIRHCDRIIFLDGGKIAEDGTYDELIEKNGLFAELVRRQQLDEDK